MAVVLMPLFPPSASVIVTDGAQTAAIDVRPLHPHTYTLKFALDCAQGIGIDIHHCRAWVAIHPTKYGDGRVTLRYPPIGPPGWACLVP